MFVAFNLRRLINIIGKNEFKKFLQGLAFFYRDILTMAEAIEAQIRAPFLANTNSTPLNQAA